MISTGNSSGKLEEVGDKDESFTEVATREQLKRRHELECRLKVSLAGRDNVQFHPGSPQGEFGS